MSTVDLARLAQRVSELPPLPAILQEVLKATNDGTLSTQRCIRLIEHDPALAARLVRLANSAFYCRTGAVGSIAGAVTLLGLRTVTGVLTATTLHACLRAQDCPEFSQDAYWRRAVSSALICSTLASGQGHDPSEAFLAGLMHDIGQLMLAVLSPREFGEVLERQGEEELLPGEEAAALGTSHTALGEQVARGWHFPGSIVHAIAHHHHPLADPPPVPQDLATLVQLCDHIVLALARNTPSDGHLLVPDAVWTALRVPEAERATFYERIGEAVSDFCRHL